MEDRKPIVAVVDDDEIFMIIAKKMFSFCAPSWQIIEFVNGEHMLEYLNQFSTHPEKLPDLILLDINMPIMDGWMFLDEYAKIKSHLSKANEVYLTSSSIDTKDTERAKKNPLLKDYIVKPLSPDIIKKIAAQN